MNKRLSAILNKDLAYFAKLNPNSVKLGKYKSEISYNEMWLKQGGKCAICGKSEPVLCVDHCHKTQYVRGLLCSNCNSGIGFLKDSPELVLKALKYLVSHCI